MFRKMRRIKQQLSEEETIEILTTSSEGVLGLIGDEGYPYTVPVSYVYDNGKLYIHSAVKGHKIDAINRNPKASFCVTQKSWVVPRDVTIYFRSAIAFGQTRLITDEKLKLDTINKLWKKYAPDYEAAAAKYIHDRWDIFAMIEFEIEHVTGKQAIELLQGKSPV